MPEINIDESYVAGEEAPKGLPMVARQNPEVLEAERARLEALSHESAGKRFWAYFSMSGPGWLQGALTLGGGSAGSSLFAGALFGYKLLWVQPLAMLLGIVMLNALAYQTLSTGLRPFHAVSRYVHPAAAWGWAIASLLASIVWCFPQYNLAADVVANMGAQAGVRIPGILTAIVILVLTTFITWNYNKGSFGMRLYENTLKVMVGLIVLCFAVVVFRTGVDWPALFQGFFGFYIPSDMEGRGVVISAFATAVGINMTFLLPYTLLARGWGREHRSLARFDLSTGLFIPFVLATSFIIIASANMLHAGYAPGQPKPSAVALSQALEPVVGPTLSHYVFGLGILGMTLSTIPLLMLVCGFIAVEVLNISPTGWGYRLATLLPAPAVLAPVLWGDLAFWLVVPTSVFGFLLLPVAYISFLILQNRRDYLGADRPDGASRWVWNLLMGLAVAVVTGGG
ncbi:MAG: divalent metal cation transporter, partial [Armatimonadetes bacterium]|nr:divalent metal cation transporter [Armatimonadota bacterium]